MPSNSNAMKAVDSLYQRLNQEAGSAGYHLNPDVPFAKELVAGLMANESRFGYRSCPCRLASGIRADDADIICPCDYRDADVSEFGACYCALYVSGEVASGEKAAHSIPERRPPPEKRRKRNEHASASTSRNEASLPYPVWRCGVCGYLCARDEPPENCPICKAKKERFERFM